MVSRRKGFGIVPGCRSIAQTVGMVTEVGTALGDPEPGEAVEGFLVRVGLGLEPLLNHGLTEWFAWPPRVDLGLRKFDEVLETIWKR